MIATLSTWSFCTPYFPPNPLEWSIVLWMKVVYVLITSFNYINNNEWITNGRMNRILKMHKIDREKWPVCDSCFSKSGWYSQPSADWNSRKNNIKEMKGKKRKRNERRSKGKGRI